MHPIILLPFGLPHEVAIEQSAFHLVGYISPNADYLEAAYALGKKTSEKEDQKMLRSPLEEELYPLEEALHYRRHDGSTILLCAALLGLLGDHTALNALAGLFAKACRGCLWPRAVTERSLALSKFILSAELEQLRSGRGGISKSSEIASFFQQHTCQVSVTEAKFFWSYERYRYLGRDCDSSVHIVCLRTDGDIRSCSDELGITLAGQSKS